MLLVLLRVAEESSASRSAAAKETAAGRRLLGGRTKEAGSGRLGSLRAEKPSAAGRLAPEKPARSRGRRLLLLLRLTEAAKGRLRLLLLLLRLTKAAEAGRSGRGGRCPESGRRAGTKATEGRLGRRGLLGSEPGRLLLSRLTESARRAASSEESAASRRARCGTEAGRGRRAAEQSSGRLRRTKSVGGASATEETARCSGLLGRLSAEAAKAASRSAEAGRGWLSLRAFPILLVVAQAELLK